jgi:hypothetical protein
MVRPVGYDAGRSVSNMTTEEVGLSGNASELIREVLSSDIDQGIEFPDKGFPWFSSVPSGNGKIIPQIKPQLLIYITNYYSLINQQFDAIRGIARSTDSIFK